LELQFGNTQLSFKISVQICKIDSSNHNRLLEPIYFNDQKLGMFEVPYSLFLFS